MHEACDLNVTQCSLRQQRAGSIRSVYLPHINTCMEISYLLHVFVIVFHRLSFDWIFFNDVILLCPLLPQWFNGTDCSISFTYCLSPSTNELILSQKNSNGLYGHFIKICVTFQWKLDHGSRKREKVTYHCHRQYFCTETGNLNYEVDLWNK